MGARAVAVSVSSSSTARVETASATWRCMLGGSRSDCATRAISGSGITNDMASVASVSKYCGSGWNSSVRHLSIAPKSYGKLVVDFKGSAVAPSLVRGSGRYITNSPRRSSVAHELVEVARELHAMITHQVLDPFRQRAAVEDLIELGARFLLLVLADEQAQAMPGQRVIGGRARLDRARGSDRSGDILVAGGEVHQRGDEPWQIALLAPSGERIRFGGGYVLLATGGGQNVDVVDPRAEIRVARAGPLQQQKVAQVDGKRGR